MKYIFETNDSVKKELECEITHICEEATGKCYVMYNFGDGHYYLEQSKELWEYVRKT